MKLMREVVNQCGSFRLYRGYGFWEIKKLQGADWVTYQIIGGDSLVYALDKMEGATR